MALKQGSILLRFFATFPIALSITVYPLLITKNSSSLDLHLKGTRFINILNFKEKQIIILKKRKLYNSWLNCLNCPLF